MGWFYGFKLHLIVDHQGGIVAAKVTPANVHDTKPVNEMVHSGMNKLYADKGYICKATRCSTIFINCIPQSLPSIKIHGLDEFQVFKQWH